MRWAINLNDTSSSLSLNNLIELGSPICSVMADDLILSPEDMEAFEGQGCLELKPPDNPQADCHNASLQDTDFYIEDVKEDMLE